MRKMAKAIKSRISTTDTRQGSVYGPRVQTTRDTLKTSPLWEENTEAKKMIARGTKQRPVPTFLPQ